MKVGTWLHVLALLGAIWAILAPVMLGYAPKHGDPWSGLILGTTILASLIILATIVGLVGFWGIFLKRLTAKPLPEPDPDE